MFNKNALAHMHAPRSPDCVQTIVVLTSVYGGQMLTRVQRARSTCPRMAQNTSSLVTVMVLGESSFFSCFFLKEKATTPRSSLAHGYDSAASAQAHCI